jgi:hypothetical protein
MNGGLLTGCIVADPPQLRLPAPVYKPTKQTSQDRIDLFIRAERHAVQPTCLIATYHLDPLRAVAFSPCTAHDSQQLRGEKAERDLTLRLPRRSAAPAHDESRRQASSARAVTWRCAGQVCAGSFAEGTQVTRSGIWASDSAPEAPFAPRLGIPTLPKQQVHQHPKIERLELGQVADQSIALEALADLRNEEVLAGAQDVVEHEEAIGFF